MVALLFLPSESLRGTRLLLFFCSHSLSQHEAPGEITSNLPPFFLLPAIRARGRLFFFCHPIGLRHHDKRNSPAKRFSSLASWRSRTCFSFFPFPLLFFSPFRGECYRIRGGSEAVAKPSFLSPLFLSEESTLGEKFESFFSSLFSFSPCRTRFEDFGPAPLRPLFWKSELACRCSPPFLLFFSPFQARSGQPTGRLRSIAALIPPIFFLGK